MTKLTDIYWIAGILEGEGCFQFQTTPKIQLKMTDYDIIERVKIITKYPLDIRVHSYQNDKYKDAYIITIMGSLAIQWMYTIYPLMSNRRREQISFVIGQWKLMPGRNTDSIKRYNEEKWAGDENKMIRQLAKFKNISFEEAKELLSKSMGDLQ